MLCYTLPTNRRALTPREYGSFTSDAVATDVVGPKILVTAPRITIVM